MTWQIFSKPLSDHVDNESNFLGCLTKLQQTRIVQEYIKAFEALAFHTRGLAHEFYLECFISGLKDAIQAQVWMHHPVTWLAACTTVCEVERALAAQSTCPNSYPRDAPPRLQALPKQLRSKRCHQRKWQKEESKDCVTIVMRNTPMGINARIQNSFKLMLLITVHLRNPFHLRD